MRVPKKYLYLIIYSTCFKKDESTIYSHQNLTPEKIHRICSSKKMEKFLSNTIPL